MLCAGGWVYGLWYKRRGAERVCTRWNLEKWNLVRFCLRQWGNMQTVTVLYIKIREHLVSSEMRIEKNQGINT